MNPTPPTSGEASKANMHGKHSWVYGRRRVWCVYCDVNQSAEAEAAGCPNGLPDDFLSQLEQGLKEAKMTTRALRLITDERERQFANGYTTQHDDLHARGQIASAAESFAAAAACQARGNSVDTAERAAINIWPWDNEPKVESDPIRNLVKAAALIVAEIERLQRLEAENCDSQSRSTNDAPIPPRPQGARFPRSFR